MALETYEVEHQKVQHVLFKPKHPWQPVGIHHRIKAAVKHLMRRKN